MTKYLGYDQITTQAEALITEHMDEALEHDDVGDRSQYVDWAFGVYLLWHDLTIGFHKEGDEERMLALVSAQDDTLIEMIDAKYDALKAILRGKVYGHEHDD